MDVLQDSEAVFGRTDAQEFLQPIVPGRGQVIERQVAGDERALQPVTQDHVRRIGHLVGVHPDEAPLHPAIVGQEVLRLPGRAFAAHDLLGQRGHEGHELAAPAGLHLDQQRLAFVQGHAARLADRLAAPVLGQAALVLGVAAFVQHAHHGREEVFLVVARGDAAVLWRAAAEGVQGDIQPPAAEIEADGLDQLAGQRLLSGLRKGAGKGQRVRIGGLAFQHLLKEPGQESGQILEHGVDALCPVARIELVEQGVIGREAEGLTLDPGDLALNGEKLGQIGFHRREVGCRAGPAPGHLAAPCGPTLGFHQIGGHGVGMQPAALHLPQVGLLPGVQSLAVLLCLGEPVREARVGDHLVAREAERGQLLAAGFG